MATAYQARRVSKPRADKIKRMDLRGALLLNTAMGYLVIEPVGSDMGDGEVLSPQEADYELQPVWFPGAKSTLREARKRLGLEAETPTGTLALMGM